MNRYILLTCLFITIGCDLDSPVTNEYDSVSPVTNEDDELSPVTNEDDSVSPVTYEDDELSPITYEYDELSRLTKVVIPHQQLEINYTYDAMGNRLTRYSQLLSE